jgi:hypothetical protein
LEEFAASGVVSASAPSVLRRGSKSLHPTEAKVTVMSRPRYSDA